MSKISVYHPSDVLAALTANSADALHFDLKKDQKTAVKYMYASFQAREIGAKLGTKTKASAILAITEKDEPMVLTKTTVNPENKTEDYRAREGYAPCIDTTVKKSGVFGRCMDELDKEWHRQMALMKENKLLVSAMPKGMVRNLVTRVYSEECPKAELKGTMREDPTYNFSIDFTSWPDKYPRAILRGQPKTLIYDYTKSYIDEKGVKQYKLATVINDAGEEELLNDKNVHKFLRFGAKVRIGRFFLDSANQSGQGIAWTRLATKLVVEPAPAEGFGDDAADGDEGVSADVANAVNAVGTVTTTVTTPITPTPTVVEAPKDVPVAVTEPAEAASADDIDGLMDQL